MGGTSAGRFRRRARQIVVLVVLFGLAACTSHPDGGANSTTSSTPGVTRVALDGVTRVASPADLEATLFRGDLATADDAIEFEGDDPLVLTKDPLPPQAAELATTARATVIELGEVDLLADATAIAALRVESNRPAVVIGDEALARAAETVLSHAPLPTGTYRVFDGSTHYIGLYGHPNTARMGLLGEQGPAKSVDRVEKLLKEYRAVAPEASFHGLFEIIATVATGGPGKRGAYSQDTPIKDLMPLVEAAAEAGVLVLIDLQPGREDFLTQAKRYEELLVLPHVGLALDPEWRLGENQVHLRQIGGVSAAEVNETADWLAALVREHALPQKLFVVHQFRSSMIQDRADLDTSHPELAPMIHVDGQGSRGSKFSTWRHLLNGAPDGIHWGWKNFIDEDPTMLSPKETWTQVDPTPGLITYQ